MKSLHSTALRRLSSSAAGGGRPAAVGAKAERLDRKHINEFSEAYPDFVQSVVPNRRIPLFESLQRADQLERRLQLDIPEFYVGSIVAVTCADPNMANRRNRFLGICIRRERHGLHHQFTLRNCINGLGVEVMYELYNPTILKIETIKLEKRLDHDLSYLQDALPEYSTFDFNLEPISHPSGSPVPINDIKVKLRPPPWRARWELCGYKGIEDAWTEATPYFKRKFHVTKMNDFHKYDLIREYRDHPETLEHEQLVEGQILDFELQRQKEGATKAADPPVGLESAVDSVDSIALFCCLKVV
ncbi:putative 39S ribosomal protein L19, mitochondrial [Aphelenchoides fujianensis]|nr:putative 39S ribosomal protein L19, mitochondrial [Aphelenchoides fujianensis]